jgi:glycogenin glucosyltransferase
MSKVLGPVRPNAIATLITTDDFLEGAQTLLYSLKVKLPAEPFASDYNPPELIVLITPNISEKTRSALYPAFCTRLLQVDPIEIPSTSSTTGTGTGTGTGSEESGSDLNSSHVASWSDKCGYSKLHIFGQHVYNKILYIDSDCLVKKDVSHLLDLENASSRGLIAAAPDIFPPDNFNAGVMLIAPSQELFIDLVSKTESTITYDGGDTGFLNAYFDDWHSYPTEGRLGFQYNAQRFMHQCTYSKQPKYWDIAVGEISIIHFSSSPKPWQSEHEGKKARLPTSSQSDFLTKEEAEKVAQCESKSKALDKLWNKWYKKSVHYKEEFEENQKLKKKQQVIKKNKPPPSAKPAVSQGAKKKKASLDFNKRFKQLRKEGLDSKQAMKKARSEFGFDKDDKVSAGKKVAQMFGMPM